MTITTATISKPRLALLASAHDYARAYARAMIDNVTLQATPDLSQLYSCNCYLLTLSGQAAGFAINRMGCIVSTFTTSNKLADELVLVDESSLAGGWYTLKDN